MAGTGIMAGICTSPYPTEKVGDSPYPYPYPVNAGIPHQNGDGFGQYPRGRVYLPSLSVTVCNVLFIFSFFWTYKKKLFTMKLMFLAMKLEAKTCTEPL